MNLILVVSTEMGWDSVIGIFDASTLTEDQYDRLEEVCEERDYILIDWKYLGSVESFLRDYE